MPTEPNGGDMPFEIKNRFSGAVIYSERHATIKDAVISARNISADLRSADLSSAHLRSADLSSADLSGANLSGADLSSADLRSADLSGADLRSADLSGADLRSADLSYADLSGANLSGANLRSADLSYANLPSGFRVAHLCFGGWPVTITAQHTAIGCQRHDNDKWLAWLPDDVSHMHSQAESWWKDHGEAVKAVIRNVMQIETASTGEVKS